jgi:hypothetical protein
MSDNTKTHTTLRVGVTESDRGTESLLGSFRTGTNLLLIPCIRVHSCPFAVDFLGFGRGS